MTGSDHQHQSAHQHQINVKKRVERLERHSVTGHPGSPRKGGVHGWGVPGEEFMEPVVEVLDKNDPNYDPDEQQKVPEKGVAPKDDVEAVNTHNTKEYRKLTVN